MFYFIKFNLILLVFWKKKIVKKCNLLKIKLVKIFKYKKNNNKY